MAVVVGQEGTILRTIDGGATWSDRSVDSGISLHAVSFVNDTIGTAVGFAYSIPADSGCDRGVILRTTDGGLSWTCQSSGTTSALRGVSFLDANTGMAVGHEGTILRTADGGATWTAQSIGTSYTLKAVSLIDANTATAVGVEGIFRTSDGGATWTRQASNPLLWGVSFGTPQTGTAVGENAKILRTENGGVTWSDQSPVATFFLLGVSFVDAMRGTAVGPGSTRIFAGQAILRTIDGGITWTRQFSGSDLPLLAVSFADANSGWAVGTMGVILHTNDGGASWTLQTGP